MANRRVVIKGNAFDVARELALAGIPFAFDRQAEGNTIGYVSRDYVPVLSGYLSKHPEMEGRFTK